MRCACEILPRSSILYEELTCTYTKSSAISATGSSNPISKMIFPTVAPQTMAIGISAKTYRMQEVCKYCPASS